MLAEEVGRIRAAGWRIGLEEDIVAFLSGQLQTNDRVAILTFDDGLAEQIAAYEHLNDMGASAIYFVPTAPITENFVLDVHKLQLIREKIEDIEIAVELDRRFGFLKMEFDNDLLAIQYRYDDMLGSRIKYFINFMLGESERLAWLSSFFNTVFGNEQDFAKSFYMTCDDMHKLSKNRMLGSHAHSHQPLAILGRDKILYELNHSRGLIESITTNFPIGISYPFGGKSAVGREVFHLASTCGYGYGFTMERGINDLPEGINPMKLRRIDSNDLDMWLELFSGDEKNKAKFIKD
jgi:hypothetical protein